MATIGRVGGATLELTAHERMIVAMVARGMSATAIAAELKRSPHTIRTQQKRIRRKLGARTNAHAVAISLRS